MRFPEIIGPGNFTGLNMIEIRLREHSFFVVLLAKKYIQCDPSIQPPSAMNTKGAHQGYLKFC